MGKTLILNSIPVYNEAPVSENLLLEKLDEFFDQIKQPEERLKILLYRSERAELKKRLNEKNSDSGMVNLKLIEVPNPGAFVYSNSSAVNNVVNGEKAKPIYCGSDESVLMIEDLLYSDQKQVYISYNKQQELLTVDRQTKPANILAAFGQIESFKGMYFGHPMGFFVSKEQLDTSITVITDQIYIFDESDCMLDRLAFLVARYESESCGQCTFGYEGVTQLQMILSDISQKKGKSEDLTLLYNLSMMMKDQSLCEIGRSAANTVITALDLYRSEIEAHLTRKVCQAGVCSKFLTYHILADRCTGCTDCLDVCDDEAILGKKRFIHVIDQDECSQCGECLSVCEKDAIIKAGVVKPRCPKKPLPCKK